MLFWILGLWLASTVTFAETKPSCFWIADSEAWFWWAVIISYQCFDNEIDIPSTIEGKKVTEIWKWAFKNTVLTTVKLPDTLKQISESAFEDNIIEKIEIPEGVEIIDNYAFKNNKLKALKLPKTLKTIGDEAFYKNNLNKIAVPGRLNKVGENAFCENEGDQVVWVSSNLEWTFKNTCFKLIKASTVENSYVWIETDFTTEITEKLWTWIRTDSPEVDELTSILEEMQNTNDTETSEWTGLSEEDREILNQLVEDSEDTLTGEELDDELEFGGIQGLGSGNGVLGVWASWSYGSLWVQGVPSAHEVIIDDDRWDFFDWLGWMLALFWSLFWFFSLMWLVSMIYEPLLVISIWEIYKKAWKRWWAFLVPVYNTMVLAEIAEDNKWRGVLPWLAPFIVLWVRLADLWIIGSYAAAILALISSVLVLWWNYKIARRFGWSVICSIANVLFTPITILFLWLRNDKYQPRKVSYDIKNPQVNEPEKSTPAPVVASEQLNNVVEHFVWPEESESSSTEKVETTNEETTTESESTIDPEFTEATESMPTVEPEITETVNLEENTESDNLLQEEVEEHSTDAFDNWSSFADNEPVKKEDYVAPVAPVVWAAEENTSTVEDNSSVDINPETVENNEENLASENTSEDVVELETESSNELTTDDNQVQLNVEEDEINLDENSETPEGEISTQEENEIILDDEEQTPDNEELVAENTETILPSFDPELTETNEEGTESSDESSNFEESSEENNAEEAVENTSEETFEETQPEESEQNNEPVEETVQPEETQDMWPDASLFEDMPQDIVGEPDNNAQEIENSEATPSEEVIDETQYPDEPISDLDQLMANNNKSL